MLFSRAIAAFLVVCSVCSISLAQTVSSVSFQVAAPAGAVSAKVVVYDEDSILDPDDKLTGACEIGTINGGTFDTGDLSKTKIPGTNHYVLRNEGGCVCGGFGSSDESEAEVYVGIQFYNSDGAKVGPVVWTSTKSCKVL